jgi:site-specific DNA-methyltransferase (adenine-specific)
MKRINIFNSLQVNSIDQVLDTASYDNARGYIFESIFHLFLTLKVFPPLKNYDVLQGNLNTDSLSRITSLAEYFRENINTGNDASDISLVAREDHDGPKYVLFTCKFLKELTNVQDLHISKIHSAILKNPKYRDSYTIYAAVKNAEEARDTISRARVSSDVYLQGLEIENILDLNDLYRMHIEFKRVYGNCDSIQDIAAILYQRVDHLEPRLGQLILIEKTLRLFQQGEQVVVWNAKPRSGKSYALAGLIVKLASNRISRTVIITPIPTETKYQFINGIFYKYHDFKNFRIVDLNCDTVHTYSADDTRNEIIVISKQLLERHENIAKYLGDIKIDTIFYDEKHFAGTTTLAKKNLAEISSLDSKHIYMTATAEKVIFKDTIKPSCILKWDLEDEGICKRGDYHALIDRHGDIMYELIRDKGIDNIRDMMKYYSNMPNMVMLSYYINSRIGELVDTINSAIGNTNNGFSPTALFEVMSITKSFRYYEQVKRTVKMLFGCGRINNWVPDNHFIPFLDKVRRINDANGASPARDIIWFLPESGGNDIADALEKVLKIMRVTENYKIIKVFDNSFMSQLQANVNNGDRTILLVGKMLSMGISLPTVDIAIMGYGSNNVQSDTYVQKAFRCMTEDVGKKYGFVIDLSPCRVINACLEISNVKRLSPHERLKRVLEYNCIDLYFDDETTPEKVDVKDIGSLLRTYYLSSENRLPFIKRELGKVELSIKKEYIVELNKFFKPSSKDNEEVTLKNKKELHNENAVELSSGISVKDNPDTTNVETVEAKEEKVLQVQFNTILPDLIILTCFVMRSRNDLESFEQCYNEFINNHESRIILIDHLSKIHKITNIDKALITINNILVESIYGDSYIENIVARTRISMQDLLDDPKRVVEFMESNLPPKKAEKRENGEVFTPVLTIETILNEIAEYYRTIYMVEPLWRRYGDNIFANPWIRWYDPAAGMGQFPVVIYARLMAGLEGVFPDPAARKKHILTHQLFMSELNSKNHYIMSEIFRHDDVEYPVKNIHLGDSLALNTMATFGVAEFDVIIGNPPYNKSFGEKNGASPLYNEFILKYIDQCKIMSFIVPSKWWGAGGKGLDSFRTTMLSRRDIYRIRHFDNASEIFQGVEIGGGVNYFIKSRYHDGDCRFNEFMIDLRCYDVLLMKPTLSTIIDKVLTKPSINDYYTSRCYGIETNDGRLTDVNSDEYCKCYVSAKHKDTQRVRYVPRKDVEKNQHFNSYQIIIPRGFSKAWTGLAPYKGIVAPGECHSGSYLSYTVESLEAAERLVKYLDLKLPNLLTSLRKSTQNINESVTKWIPLPPMDRDWTDEQLYDWLELTPAEREIINNTDYRKK